MALAVAVALVLLVSGNFSSANSTTVVAGHKVTPGKVPAYLRIKPSTPTVPQASLASPILDAEQGFAVHVTLPSGSADVTAVGPTFPNYVSNYAQDGNWPAAKLVPLTFQIKFANVKGTIPLKAADFNVEDQRGQYEPVKLSGSHGGSVPSLVRAGHKITLNATSTGLQGQGGIGWMPNGKKPAVAWIFQLELD